MAVAAGSRGRRYEECYRVRHAFRNCAEFWPMAGIAVSALSATSRNRGAHGLPGEIGDERLDTDQGGEIGTGESAEGDASRPDSSGRYRTVSVPNPPGDGTDIMIAMTKPPKSPARWNYE